MGFKPRAFSIGKVSVEQDTPTRSSKTPIAGRQPSFKKARNGLRDDRLVVALSQRIGLGHTRQTTIPQKTLVATSFVNFAGVVGIENLDLTIPFKMLNAQTRVHRVLSFSGVHVAKAGIDIKDRKGLLFPRKTQHALPFGIKVVSGDEPTPTLGFVLKSPSMRLLVLHRAAITRITVRIFKAMRRTVFQRKGVSFQISLGSFVHEFFGAGKPTVVVRATRAAFVDDAFISVNKFGASGTRNPLNIRTIFGGASFATRPQIGDVIPNFKLNNRTIRANEIGVLVSKPHKGVAHLHTALSYGQHWRSRLEHMWRDVFLKLGTIQRCLVGRNGFAISGVKRQGA